MPGYKDFIRAGLGILTEDKVDIVKGLFVNEQETESSVLKLEQEIQLLKEREELANLQSRLYELVNRNQLDYIDLPKPKHNRSKSESCKRKEVAKRRKNNRNKKTHRKK